MASYNIQGIDSGLDKTKKEIIDLAENVQTTADDPNSNEQDLYSDIRVFQEQFAQKEIGQKLMLSAVKGNFTVDDVILQEVK